MSKVKSREPVSAPVWFLKEGRLPNDTEAVRANYKQQIAEVECIAKR